MGVAICGLHFVCVACLVSLLYIQYSAYSSDLTCSVCTTHCSIASPVVMCIVFMSLLCTYLISFVLLYHSATLCMYVCRVATAIL